MKETPNRRWAARILGLLCAVVLGSTLTAGLWPFHAPRNNVSWLTGKRGLHFGRQGTILSSGAFKSGAEEGASTGSLEIWVTPSSVWDRKTTLLAFYTPEEGERCALSQTEDNLTFESAVQTPGRKIRRARLHLDNVFHYKESAFIVVASGPQRTAVWVNGSLVQSTPDFPLALTGSLVVANSPVESNSWAGDLRGLAIYHSELTQEQILRHYQTWTTAGSPRITGNDRAAALYLFDEGRGSIVHNRAGSGIDLYIPRHYVLLHEKFLEPFWEEFSWDAAYRRAVLINVAGFMPLGFFFCAYFDSLRQVKRAALAAMAFGFMVSLTIETLQGFLPTRDSGTTDIVTNTLGTCLGTALYLKTVARVWLARILGRIPIATRR